MQHEAAPLDLVHELAAENNGSIRVSFRMNISGERIEKLLSNVNTSSPWVEDSFQTRSFPSWEKKTHFSFRFGCFLEERSTFQNLMPVFPREAWERARCLTNLKRRWKWVPVTDRSEQSLHRTRRQGYRMYGHTRTHGHREAPSTEAHQSVKLLKVHPKNSGLDTLRNHFRGKFSS